MEEYSRRKPKTFGEIYSYENPISRFMDFRLS